MKKTKILIFFLWGQASLWAQSPKQQIEAEIEQVMAQENIPAISLAFIHGDKQVSFIHKGNVNRNGGGPISKESVFQIGSLGKMFIGIIANSMILENKIDINQSIVDFLPQDYAEKTKQKLRSISIKQLLHHRSGLPRNPKAGYKRKDGDPYLYLYTEKDFRSELEKVRLKKPGEAYQYSNLGYGLLAYILELASQLTFAELLDKYICQPYHLENTGLTSPPSNLVTPYRKDERTKASSPWKMGKMAPPSAIYSTTQDLSRFMRQHISAYQNFESSQALSPLNLSYDKRPLRENASVSYGYGLFIGQNGIVGHGGDLDGYGCEYTFSVPDAYGVVLLTSSGGKWIPPLIQKINDILAK